MRRRPVGRARGLEHRVRALRAALAQLADGHGRGRGCDRGAAAISPPRRHREDVFHARVRVSFDAIRGLAAVEPRRALLKRVASLPSRPDDRARDARALQKRSEARLRVIRPALEADEIDGPPNPAFAFCNTKPNSRVTSLGFKNAPESPRIDLQCSARACLGTPHAHLPWTTRTSRPSSARERRSAFPVSRASPPARRTGRASVDEGLGTPRGCPPSLRSRAATAANAESTPPTPPFERPERASHSRFHFPAPDSDRRDIPQGAGHGRLALEARVREREVRARDFAIRRRLDAPRDGVGGRAGEHSGGVTRGRRRRRREQRHGRPDRARAPRGTEPDTVPDARAIARACARSRRTPFIV